MCFSVCFWGDDRSFRFFLSVFAKAIACMFRLFVFFFRGGSVGREGLAVRLLSLLALPARSSRPCSNVVSSPRKVWAVQAGAREHVHMQQGRIHKQHVTPARDPKRDEITDL